MDTTDSKIRFNDDGLCDYCLGYKNKILSKWEPNKDRTEELIKISGVIKNKTRKDKYDCIIGMSGGTDSSYLLYVATKIMKLRPLVYTVDTGWNTDIANLNIKKIVDKLGLTLYVEKINEEEMNDLQISFLKSNVPYQDFPQDHAIFAGLYNFAIKNKIKYVLTGANNSTEGIRPPIEWVYVNDLKLMKSIHKQFGKVKLDTFPMCSMFKYRVFYPYFKGMKRIAPLDYLPYEKDKVEEFLKNEFGWEKYENKHYENVFTRFYEGYYLPQKFNFDKRRSYFTNLILTNQMTRDEALKQISKQPYDSKLVMEDKLTIATKLNISINELEQYISGSNKSYKDYKNSFRRINLYLKIANIFGKEKRNFR